MTSVLTRTALPRVEAKKRRTRMRMRMGLLLLLPLLLHNHKSQRTADGKGEEVRLPHRPTSQRQDKTGEPEGRKERKETK
jgi:hypothetical protein